MGWLVLWADEFRQLSKHILGAIGFVLNVMLSSEAGYFDAAVETKPLLHLWSLSVEEQYYIIWPPIIFTLRNKRQALVLTILAIAAFSFLLNVGRIHDHRAATFFLPTSRIWELLIGAWLAHGLIYSEHPVHEAARKGFSRLLGVSPAVLNAIKPAVGFMLIVGSAALLDQEQPFPGWLALLPTVGSFLIISAGPDAPFNRRLLSHPAAVFVGLISYPLYLWHWPLLVYARLLAGGPPDFSIRATIILTSFFLAWATYQWVERPIRANDGRIVVRGLFGSGAAIAGLAAVVFLTQGATARFEETASGLIKEFDAARDKYPKCSGDRLGSEELTWCSTSQNGAPRYAIFGDSHADHLFPGIAKEDAANWLLIGQTSCPPALGVRAYFDWAEEECSFKNAAAVEIIGRQPGIFRCGSFFPGPLLYQR
jgi:peptidoglycan/LPS O-acetylase OafA/YrhL